MANGFGSLSIDDYIRMAKKTGERRSALREREQTLAEQIAGKRYGNLEVMTGEEPLEQTRIMAPERTGLAELGLKRDIAGKQFGVGTEGFGVAGLETGLGREELGLKRDIATQQFGKPGLPETLGLSRYGITGEQEAGLRERAGIEADPFGSMVKSLAPLYKQYMESLPTRAVPGGEEGEKEEIPFSEYLQGFMQTIGQLGGQRGGGLSTISNKPTGDRTYLSITDEEKKKMKQKGDYSLVDPLGIR